MSENTPFHRREETGATAQRCRWRLGPRFVRRLVRSASLQSRRAGVSLYEVIIALAVIGVLMASSAPSFSRSIEQSHADMAGANLRAIWSAQRLYWLEHRTFADDLTTLESLGLLDPTIISGGRRYRYAIADSDDETFAASATRVGSARWSGQFSVDETGSVSGTIQASGVPDISPGFVD